MTPLIKEFAGIVDDSEALMWFDIGHAPEGYFDFEIDGEHLTHIPFKHMAVCGVDAAGFKFMLRLIGGDGHVTVAGLLASRGMTRSIDAFSYVDTPEGVRLMPPPSGHTVPKKEDCITTMSAIGMMLDALDSGGQAFSPKVKSNSPTNQRRMANGKPALIYDWRTVVIEPKKVATEPQGGTHASPRQHARRGHWRVTQTGRKCWVKDCIVGDASKGAVFHDYKVPT